MSAKRNEVLYWWCPLHGDYSLKRPCACQKPSGKVKNQEAGRCVSWDQADKMEARAFRWIDRAGFLYHNEFYEAASKAADRGMELWGASTRLRKKGRRSRVIAL